MGSESRRQARVADFAQDHVRTVGPPILSLIAHHRSDADHCFQLDRPRAAVPVSAARLPFGPPTTAIAAAMPNQS